MKKLFLVATLCVAGLVSAKETKFNQFKTDISMMEGWCEVIIYRVNYDGSKTMVSYSLTYEKSEAACNAKGSSMMLAAQLQGQ